MGVVKYMAKSLAVFVSSDQHLDKTFELCMAANKKGVKVSIFLTHLGILLTRNPRFPELSAMAEVALCNVAFENLGLKPPVPGIDDKDFVTQARHAEIIEGCDRYVVF